MKRGLMNKKLIADQVLITYKTQEQYNPSFFIERRAILRTKTGLALGPSQPMDEQVLKNIAQLYASNESMQLKHSLPIPEHIIVGNVSIGTTVTIWYRKAIIRPLNITASKKLSNNSPKPLPATLYCVLNDEFYVFALDNNNRPDGETKLYHAPFFNVYNTGLICKGTAFFGKVGKTFTDEAARYEAGFYMAQQSRQNNSKAAKTSLVQLWESLDKKKEFPTKELVQHTFKTLQEFIDKVVKPKI